LTPGDATTGIPLLLAHLVAVGASLLLLAIWVGIGATVRRLVARAHPLDSPARWLVDAMLGAGTLATVLFTLGIVGILTAPVVLGTTLLACAVAWRETLGALREAQRAIAALFSAPGTKAAPLAVSLLALLLLAGAVAPPTEWDTLTYHLRIPLGILDTGRIEVPRDSFHVGHVRAAQFSTLPLLAAGILAGPAVMQVLSLVLLMLGTFALATAVQLSRRGSWLAIAVLLGCPIIALGAITARVDVMLMAALLAAHLVLLEAAAPGAIRPRLVIVAALLVGVAMAIKPQAGAYALALAPIGLRAARGVRVAAGAAVAAAAVAAPWYLKNMVLVGAPLYPIGAPGWFEPWIAEIYGGRVIPPGVDTSPLSAIPSATKAFNLFDAFLSPGSLTIEGEGRFYALSPVLLLLPLVVLHWRSRRPAIETALVGVAYAAVAIFILRTGLNLRYLMPALSALAVGAAAAVDGVADRLRGAAGVRRVVFGILVAIAVIPLVPALLVRFGGDMVLIRHALGAASARDVWERHPDRTVARYAPVVTNVRRLVPSDARLLMFWEARALPLQRDVIADVMLSNWTYLAQSPAVGGCLAGTGITHVLVNVGALRYYLGRGARPEAFRLDDLRHFLSRCAASPIDVGPGFVLFVIRPAGGAPSDR